MEDSEEIKVQEQADQEKDKEDESEQQNEEEKAKVCCESCVALYSNMLGYVASAQRAVSEINRYPRAD
jgi:hypothetical protein